MTAKNTTPVRKAVIAAAGFGTRFLPQTKAMPKEMLPLVDKPIIQYIVEELADAGIEDIIIVTGYHKRSIEDHFDHLSADLRTNLKDAGKLELLEATKKISGLAHFAYVRQKGPYGTATPLLGVSHLIGDEPFIYTFADDIILAKPNGFSQMIGLYEDLHGSILPCIEIERAEDFDNYGIIGGQEIRPNVLKVSEIVEKPGADKAPSKLASIGSFLLTPEVFDYLKNASTNLPEGSEFYLSTFVLDLMAKAGEPVFASTIKNSHRYDTGNKLSYLKAVVDFGLMNDELKDDFQKFLRDKIPKS